LNKILAAAICVLAVVLPAVADASLVNDFYCNLRAGQSLPQLYEFQTDWMKVARKSGLPAEVYDTAIVLPVYAENITNDPLNFVWRGTFKDMQTLTKVLDVFYGGNWQNKFYELMNCTKGSLWTIPK
jgi:hypothetical protein